MWVTGDKTRMYWTLRALARAGYMVVQDAEFHISVTETSWIVDNAEYRSVEKLLEKLNLLLNV